MLEDERRLFFMQNAGRGGLISPNEDSDLTSLDGDSSDFDNSRPKSPSAKGKLPPCIDPYI